MTCSQCADQVVSQYQMRQGVLPYDHLWCDQGPYVAWIPYFIFICSVSNSKFTVFTGYNAPDQLILLTETQ